MPNRSTSNQSITNRSSVPEASLDALGMFFSFACLLHCLALPLLLALLPLTAGAVFIDERFHRWMLLGVVPVSALALGAACFRRRAYGIAWIGIIGVSLLSCAAFGPEFAGLSGLDETRLTVAGALLLCAAHLLNARASGLLHWHRRNHAAHPSH